MATAASSYVYQSCGIIQSNENYVRIITLLNYSEMELYYKIFHDQQFGGFPTDPQKLYKQLKLHDMEIQALLNQKLISKTEYILIFPEKGETYSQEFTVNLFYALAKHCVKKFPPIRIANGESPRDSPTTFLNEMEKLQGYSKSKTLKTVVNSSNESFDQNWNEIIEVLKSLSFDVNKVSEMRNIYLDANKKFRYAVIRAEISLLTSECEDLLKTADVNTLALNKLLANFTTAISESQVDNHVTQSAISKQSEYTDEDIKTLKREVHTAASNLSGVFDELKALKPNMKYWREKNIEGDIIILDEEITKLKNQIKEQEFTVGNLFSSVSLDIVRIKERMSFHGDESKFIVSPDPKRNRSDSKLSDSKRDSKRDSKFTDV